MKRPQVRKALFHLRRWTTVLHIKKNLIFVFNYPSICPGETYTTDCCAASISTALHCFVSVLYVSTWFKWMSCLERTYAASKATAVA